MLLTLWTTGHGPRSRNGLQRQDNRLHLRRHAGHSHRGDVLITREQYFTDPHTKLEKEHTEEHERNFNEWQERDEALTQEAINDGAFERAIDPDTGSEISGARGGDGDGGFRAKGSKTGKPGGPHYDGRAGDRYDPGNRLDTWLDKFEDGKGGNRMLLKHGLYREHPSATDSWCHTQTKPTVSGRRTFYP